MTQETTIRCQNCDSELESDREKAMLICFECRKYGLLNGCWPQRFDHHSATAGKPSHEAA
jgi:hypothetical protein